MEIKLPSTDRRKALFLIDIQPGSLSESVLPLVESIRSFVATTDYNVYVQVSYFADENSMFAKQGQFVLSKEDAGTIAEQLVAELERKSSPVLTIEKNVRSCFKGLDREALHTFLQEHNIHEVHLVGYDINDCVLASAYDSIDRGYFTYVIEELCHHWDGCDELKDAAVTILRHQAMTNNSSKDETMVIAVAE